MRRSTYRSSISLPASVRESKLYHKSKENSRSWAERIVQFNVETGLMIFYASKGGARLQKDRITLKGAEFSIIDESIAERKFSMLLNLMDGSSEIIAADNTEELNNWTGWITGYLGTPNPTQKNTDKSEEGTEKTLMTSLFNKLPDDNQSNQQQQKENFTIDGAFEEDTSDILSLGKTLFHNPLSSQQNEATVAPLQPAVDSNNTVTTDTQQSEATSVSPQEPIVSTEPVSITTTVTTDSPPSEATSAPPQEPVVDSEPVSTATTVTIESPPSEANSTPPQESVVDSEPIKDSPRESQSAEATSVSPQEPIADGQTEDTIESNSPGVPTSASTDNGDNASLSLQKKPRPSATNRRSSSIVSELVRQASLEIGFKDTQANSYVWNFSFITLDINTGILTITSDKSAEKVEDIRGRNSKTVSINGKNFVMAIYGNNEDESDAILIACQNKDSFRDWSIWIKTCTSMVREGQDSQISVRRKSIAVEKPSIAAKTALLSSTPTKSASFAVKRSSVTIVKIDSVEFKVTQIKTPFMELTRRLHLWYERQNEGGLNVDTISALRNSTDEGIASVALALGDHDKAPDWLDAIDMLRIYEKDNPTENIGNTEIIFFATVTIPSISNPINLELSTKESVNSISKKLFKQIPPEYYVNEEDLRKKVSIAMTKENNNISQQVTEILLEDLRNVQSMMLSHENTIDSLRDEISAVDELGLEAEANLTRKENEKIALQSEVESLRARVKECEGQMVAIALSAQEHVDELQDQIAILGGEDAIELKSQLSAALEREEDLNSKIITLNASTSTRVEELSLEIHSFQRLIDTRYEEVKRSESARIILEDELVRVDMVTDKLKLDLERANSIIAELQRENQQLKEASDAKHHHHQPENVDFNISVDKKRSEVINRHSPKANDLLHSQSTIHPKSNSPRIKEDKNRMPSGFLSPTSSQKAKAKDSLISAQIIDSTTPLRVAGVWK